MRGQTISLFVKRQSHNIPYCAFSNIQRKLDLQ